MTRSKGSNDGSLYIADYPIYAVDVIGQSSLILAGGGGAAKTGVPNRLDIINLSAVNHQKNATVYSPISKYVGGLDTGVEAVMNLRSINAGYCTYITSIEGKYCVEYLAKLNHQTAYDGIPSRNTCISANNSLMNDFFGDTKDVSMDSESVVRNRTVFKDTTNSPSINSDRNTSGTDATVLSGTQSVAKIDDASSVKWELVKTRSFSVPSLNVHPTYSNVEQSFADSTPTCITTGGVGGRWLAVGVDTGSVFLFNRHTVGEAMDDGFFLIDDDRTSLTHVKPSFVYSDVSGGHGSSVCSLTLTCLSTLNESSNTDVLPFLATVTETPGWNQLRIWHSSTPYSGISSSNICRSSDSVRGTTKSRKSPSPVISPRKRSIDMSSASDLHPYAVASCEAIGSLQQHVGNHHSSNINSSTHRFRHCQFLNFTSAGTSPESVKPTCTQNGTFEMLSPFVKSHYLASTVQPLSANRHSVSHLVVWIVPVENPIKTDKSSRRPIQLMNYADAALPTGHLPACLATHPSRSRGLIAIGTMEGCVLVYHLIEPKSLNCVYRLNNAHPIFVTDLAFLSSQYQSRLVTTTAGNFTQSPSIAQPSSFDLVSVSVDRVLRWHAGPSFIHIGYLSRHSVDPQSRSSFARFCWSTLTVILICFALLLFPVWVTLFDFLLATFFPVPF